MTGGKKAKRADFFYYYYFFLVFCFCPRPGLVVFSFLHDPKGLLSLLLLFMLLLLLLLILRATATVVWSGVNVFLYNLQEVSDIAVSRYASPPLAFVPDDVRAPRIPQIRLFCCKTPHSLQPPPCISGQFGRLLDIK